MKLIVDRITQDLAVCETEEQTFVKVPLELLPQEVREGSVLHFLDGIYSLDSAEEAERRRRLFELQTQLFDEEDS